MVRKIVEKIPDEVLQKDLKKYRKMAMDLGATDAEIITTDMVVVDDRVRAKCLFPKCEWYGTNMNCPPYTMDLEQTRKLVNSFRYAIFFRIKVPPEILSSRPTPEQQKQRMHNIKTRLKIVSKIESEAFYDGYYLSLGFGGGSACKKILCSEKECQALKVGQGCRFPLYARSAMEAVGMDVYLLATKVGWDIYPIGMKPAGVEVLHGTLLGIVFIY